MPSLPVLLSHALHDINRRFKRDGVRDGEQPSLLVWADLLRVIPDDSIPLSELPGAARISRRAVKAWLTVAEKRGWLQVEATAPRVKLVKMTDLGRRVRDIGAARVAATELEWTASVKGTQALRGALETLIGALDLELPHYPMTYGTADPSAIGGGAVPPKPGPPRIPAHGTDWVPVVRSGTGSATGLPLHALLSQALMAFTIDFEERRFPMGVAAALSRALPAGSVALDTLPARFSVTGSSQEQLEHYGVIRVTGKGDKRKVRLTEGGTRVRDMYEPGIADVTDTWRDRYGNKVVDPLVESLSSVDDQLPDDLPDDVIVRFTVGVGFLDVSMTG